MDRIKKLELNLETVRDLSDEDLQSVEGGAQTKTCGLLTTTQTPACPSGATWFTSCESYNGQTCS